MNQPKFKFDEVVQRAGGKNAFSFRITQIQKHKGEYLYSHMGGDWHREDSLEPIKEPQKKKLYAYKLAPAESRWERVDFFTSEKPADSCFKRAPEYDIEYPEIK